MDKCNFVKLSVNTKCGWTQQEFYTIYNKIIVNEDLLVAVPPTTTQSILFSGNPRYNDTECGSKKKLCNGKFHFLVLHFNCIYDNACTHTHTHMHTHTHTHTKKKTVSEWYLTRYNIFYHRLYIESITYWHIGSWTCCSFKQQYYKGPKYVLSSSFPVSEYYMGYSINISKNVEPIKDDDISTAGKQSIDLSCYIDCKFFFSILLYIK